LSVRLHSAEGRGVLLASMLGSGMAFLEVTAVNVALPALGRSLHADLAGLQWTVNAYLLTLSAFLLTGGGLGDRLGRKRVFSVGVLGFAGTSVLCGLASDVQVLNWARGLQGGAAALMIPVSLAMMRADLAEEDQGEALGLWTGMSGVAGAIGPFLGGWLVNAFSWRSIFFVNVPLAAVALWAAWRFLPAEAARRSPVPLDLLGTATAAVAVGGLTYALIEGPPKHWPTPVLAAAVVGAVGGVAFLLVERRPGAMVPLSFFRVRAFAGANLATFFLYAALSAALFLLVLQLQLGLGLSPLASGGILLPATALMAVLSPLAGRWAQAHGTRWPMVVGAVITTLAFVAFTRVSPGSGWPAALPGMVLFGLGLSIAVAPLTQTVLGALAAEHAGVASGVNNAIARVAGLLGVAAIPWASGLAGAGAALSPEELNLGFHRAMWICAGLSLLAAIASAVGVRGGGEPTRAVGVTGLG
jgi:EmrB/QacA subfamily drug resistance transporter